MGSFSIWHWLVVLVIVLLLFGAGKIPKLMGDMAKGVKAFKHGLKEAEEEAKANPPSTSPTPQVGAQSQSQGEAHKETPKA